MTSSKMVSREVVRTLQLFWDKQIKQVSPGALGMTMPMVQHPLSDEVAQTIVDDLSFARWEKGWILLDREPNGGIIV